MCQCSFTNQFVHTYKFEIKSAIQRNNVNFCLSTKWVIKNFNKFIHTSRWNTSRWGHINLSFLISVVRIPTLGHIKFFGANKSLLELREKIQFRQPFSDSYNGKLAFLYLDRPYASTSNCSVLFDIICQVKLVIWF